MTKKTLPGSTATSPMMMYVICSFANDYSLLSARIVFRVSWLMSLHLWWEQNAAGAWKSHGALTSPRPFNVPVGKGRQPSRREHASKPAKQAWERACVFLSQVDWAAGAGRLYMLSSPAITIQLWLPNFQVQIHLIIWRAHPPPLRWAGCHSTKNFFPI